MAPIPKKRPKSDANSRKAKNECEQRRRDQIKSDPEKYEEFKRKERERYYKRKEAGKIKNISQLSDREKRAKRKNWVQKTRKSRLKKAQEENLLPRSDTPPDSEGEINLGMPIVNVPVVGRLGSSRQNCGKKMAKRNNSKAYREIKRLKEKLEKERGEKLNMKRNKERYKKKYYRLIEKNKNINSPLQKVKRLLQGERVSPKVRRALEFGAALTAQVEENYKNNKESRKSKKAFGMVLAGKVIKKYRVMHKIPVGSYWKRLSKMNGNNKLIVDSILLQTKYQTKNEVKVRADVVMFFEQDDVSRIEPGIKDCITKNKVKKQKRTLMGNLKSLHKKFEVENGYIIPYSSFCAYRPFWVQLPHVTKRDTCACEKHENFSLLFEKLKYFKVINYNDPDEMIKSICCQDTAKTNEECLERKCQKCIAKTIEVNCFENVITSVEQWKRKDVKYIVKGVEKSTKKVVKEKIELELKDIVNKIIDSLPSFMKHICNIIHQYRSIFNLKKTMTTNEIIIHVDFSQNYECKYSKEIQSVHFGGSHEQTTLHTGVIYFKDNQFGKPKVFPFSSLSQSLRHDSSAIAAHLKPVLDHAKTLVQDIQTIHFLSDSPTTQYRNRTLFYLIVKYLQTFCSKTVTWNYSECGHGKGAPDGIGGALKRMANRLVAEGTDLHTFHILFEALKEHSSIKLFLVTVEDIEKIDAIISNHIPPCIGTMRVHQVLWTSEDEGGLEMRRLSCFDCLPPTRCTHYHVCHFYPLIPALQKNKQILLQPSHEMTNLSLEKPGSSHQLKIAQSKRVGYEDVYTDSEDDGKIVEEKLKLNNISNNEYMIVKVFGKKSVSHFVANVTKCLKGAFQVRFMLKCRDTKNKFIFSKETEALVKTEEVVSILQQPIMNSREQYIFEQLPPHLKLN